MPAAPLAQRQTNLARLCGAHTQHCQCNAQKAQDSGSMAQKLPLSHATSRGTLIEILGSEALLSQMAVDPRSDSAESVLETADDVFLYLGAFAYPDTVCGFLFLRALEDAHQTDGVSTPFDSGALVSKVSPPTGYSQDISGRVDFVRAHELPVSDYRDLLSQIIADYDYDCDAYLREPEKLVCGCGAVRDHPFGLVGGDWRTVTFEVRIPKRVPLSSPHLCAVFVPNGLEPPELDTLFAAGVRIERYDPGSGPDSFRALRTACISFIRGNLL